MDLLAKDIARQQIYPNTNIQVKDTVLGLGTISCSGDMITSRIQKSLYPTILHTALVEQYSNQLQIPVNIIKNTVHWPSI